MTFPNEIRLFFEILNVLDRILSHFAAKNFQGQFQNNSFDTKSEQKVLKFSKIHSVVRFQEFQKID